jgi:hypothetical protein
MLVVYLHDRWTIFKLHQLAAGKPHTITTPQQSVDIFFTCTNHEQNLLCELYLLNFILPEYVRWNPQSICQVCQGHSIKSFPYIYGLIKWKEDIEFHAQAEFNTDFLIIPDIIMQDFQRLLDDPRDSFKIQTHHQHAIVNYQEISQIYSLAALLVSHDIWHRLPNALRNRSPTRYLHFQIALSRGALYINSLKRHGNRWIGLRFHYPLLWCSTKQYRLFFNGMTVQKHHSRNKLTEPLDFIQLHKLDTRLSIGELYI